MKATETSRRIFANAAANILGMFWVRLLSFLIVPLMFRYLGKDRWAVYGLALTVVMLSSVLDPGLRYGFMKVIAECIAGARRHDLKKIIGASFVFYLVLGVVYQAIAWLAIEPILSLAGVDPAVRGDARFFFQALLAWSFLVQAFSVFNQLLLGAQRMTLSNILGSVAGVFHYGGILLAVLLNAGLRGIAMVFVAAAVFEGILNVAATPSTVRRVPDTGPRTPLCDLMRHLLHFGWRVKIATNCNTLMFHTDKIFISNFVSFQAAGLYQLGSTLAIVLREFVRLWVTPLLPVTTTLAARGQMGRMRSVNRLTSRWFLSLSSPCFLFVSAMAPAILRVWMGNSLHPTDLPQASLALGLLCLAFYADTATYAAMQVGSGLHLPHLQMRSALLAVVVSLTLNFAFVLTLGFAGVPLASILALSLGSLYYGWMLTGALKDRFFPFLGEVFLRPFLAAALPAVLLLWLNSHWIVPRLLEAGRVRAIFYVGVLFSLYLCVYAVLLFLSGHVKPEDLEFFKTLIPRRESQAEAWRDYAPREP